MFFLCIFGRAWALSVWLRTVSADATLSSLHGAANGETTAVLNQGRINSVEWGISSSSIHALVIANFTADRQTKFGSDAGFGNDAYSPCDPVSLSSDDYILGCTTYSDDYNIYGMNIYTFTGQVFKCPDSESVSNKTITTIAPSTNYVSNSDFNYLSGWIVYHVTKINGIQFQFTNIATSYPLVEDLPDSSFFATSSYNDTNRNLTIWPYLAKYSAEGWRSAVDIDSDGEALVIDLLRTMKISAIGTKGSSYYDAWVTQYAVVPIVENVSMYLAMAMDVTPDTFLASLLSISQTVFLPGNTDRTSETLNEFGDSPHTARAIIFAPLTYETARSMRVEIYGYEVVTTQYQPANVITEEPTTSTPTNTEDNDQESLISPSETAILYLLIGALFAIVLCLVCCILLAIYCYMKRAPKRVVEEQKNQIVHANNVQNVQIAPMVADDNQPAHRVQPVDHDEDNEDAKSDHEELQDDEGEAHRITIMSAASEGRLARVISGVVGEQYVGTLSQIQEKQSLDLYDGANETGRESKINTAGMPMDEFVIGSPSVVQAKQSMELNDNDDEDDIVALPAVTTGE